MTNKTTNLENFNKISGDLLETFGEIFNKKLVGSDIYNTQLELMEKDTELAVFLMNDEIPLTKLTPHLLQIKESIKNGEMGVDKVLKNWAGLADQIDILPNGEDAVELVNPFAFSYVHNLYKALRSTHSLITAMPLLEPLVMEANRYKMDMEKCAYEIDHLKQSIPVDIRDKIKTLEDARDHYSGLGDIINKKKMADALKELFQSDPVAAEMLNKQQALLNEYRQFNAQRECVLSEFLKHTAPFTGALFAVMGEDFFILEGHDRFSTNPSSDRVRIISSMAGQLLQLCSGNINNLQTGTNPLRGLVDQYVTLNPLYYTPEKVELIRCQIMYVGKLILDRMENLPDEIFEFFRESQEFRTTAQLIQMECEHKRVVNALSKRNEALMNFYSQGVKDSTGLLYNIVNSNIGNEHFKISLRDIGQIYASHASVNGDNDPTARIMATPFFAITEIMRKVTTAVTYYKGDKEYYVSKVAAECAQDFNKISHHANGLTTIEEIAERVFDIYMEASGEKGFDQAFFNQEVGVVEGVLRDGVTSAFVRIFRGDNQDESKYIQENLRFIEEDSSDQNKHWEDSDESKH